jgi:hypothetical protein
MTRTRGPGNLVARRTTTAAQTYADAHQNYAAMIDHDLGGRQASYRAVDEGRPPSTLALMVRPLALFLFACLGFVIVLLLWLWQVGVFERLKPEARPVPVASVSWMGARPGAPLASPDEADVTPATAPVAKPAPVPTDAAETNDPDTAEAEDHPDTE